MLRDQNTVNLKPFKNNLSLFGKKIDFVVKKQEKILKRHGSNRPHLSVLGLSPRDLKVFTTREICVLMALLPPKERDKCKPKSWFIIYRSNVGKKLFDLVIDFLLLFSTISSLFYLAFQPELSLEVRMADTVIWFWFVIDFFLNFVTEKLNKKGKKELRFKQIIIIYLKTWLVPDLLSIIPLIYTGNPNSECFLRLVRLFKCDRLFNRINIFKLADKLIHALFKSETRMKKKLRMFIIYSWSLFGYILLMFFSTYCLACLWIFYVEAVNRNFNEKNNFEEHFGLKIGFSYSKLIKTWYFVFSTIITVGFGDFYATNMYEMIVAIFFVVSAPTWFAFIVNKTRLIIDDLQEVSGKVKKDYNELSIWISQLENSHHRLPIKLKNNINSHFKHYWKNDRLGKMSTLIQGADCIVIRDEYFKSMSESLKERVYEYLFNDVFYRFRYFFRYFNSLRHKISGFLQPRFYENSSIILKINRKVEEITFVCSGNFEIGVFIGSNYVDVYSVKTAFVIGEFFAFKDIPSFVQFTSMSKLHGYSIPVEVLKDLKKTNPSCIKEYLSSVEKYYKVIQDKITSVNEKNYLETDEFGNSAEKFNGLSKDSSGLEGLKEKGKKNKENSVFQEFGLIEKAVEDFKKVRKEKMDLVKEKIVGFLQKKKFDGLNLRRSVG